MRATCPVCNELRRVPDRGPDGPKPDESMAEFQERAAAKLGGECLFAEIGTHSKPDPGM